jgi:hypothetical protein
MGMGVSARLSLHFDLGALIAGEIEKESLVAIRASVATHL